MDHDPLGAVPAMYRHIRMRGLMPCCFDSVGTSRRLTRPGAQLQCQVCQAVMTVDDAGAWCWEEVRFLGDTPSMPSQSNRPSVSSEGQA
jgi:hypothetical protein